MRWTAHGKAPAARSAVVMVSMAATTPTIIVPGGGTMFWWQLGAAGRLSELYDLSAVPMVGCSAGALCVASTRCGVDPRESHRLAYQLCDDAGVLTNPLGLCGKWEGIIKEWLEKAGFASLVTLASPSVRLDYGDRLNNASAVSEAMAHFIWLRNVVL